MCTACVQLCSLCTTLHICAILHHSGPILVLFLWSYSPQKLFLSLISFTLCHVQLSKSSKMLHVYNRQSEPNANNVLGVYECFWIVKMHLKLCFSFIITFWTLSVAFPLLPRRYTICPCNYYRFEYVGSWFEDDLFVRRDLNTPERWCFSIVYNDGS